MRVTIMALGLAATVSSCGPGPIVPSPPTPVVHSAAGDPLFPSDVRQVEIDHGGCFGTCPIYRVSIANTGLFEYEGKKFVVHVGSLAGNVGLSETIGLFSWLQDHAGVYAPHPEMAMIADAEVTTYRFLLKNGARVEFRVNDDKDRDLWVFTRLVDGVVGLALRPAT